MDHNDLLTMQILSTIKSKIKIKILKFFNYTVNLNIDYKYN